MAGEGKGFIGSVAVHAGIIAVLIGASWFASRHTGESLEAYDPLIVTLDGIPGKKPGQIGKTHGVAQGDERGVAGGVHTDTPQTTWPLRGKITDGHARQQRVLEALRQRLAPRCFRVHHGGGDGGNLRVDARDDFRQLSPLVAVHQLGHCGALHAHRVQLRAQPARPLLRGGGQ